MVAHKILKETVNLSSMPLAHVIKMSLREGIVPPLLFKCRQINP